MSLELTPNPAPQNHHKTLVLVWRGGKTGERSRGPNERGSGEGFCSPLQVGWSGTPLALALSLASRFA